MTLDEMRALPEDPELTRAIAELANRMLDAVPGDTDPALVWAALGRCVVILTCMTDGTDAFVQEVLGSWLTAVANDAWVARQEGES